MNRTQAFSITAAIPTYKRPRQFGRALESVLAQSEQPDKIIVGDDGADEEVREICDSFRDSRIVYVARYPKLRMTENWDFVMRWASDGLVALLEDDNIWLPNHLENAKKLFRRFPDAGLYHAGHQEAWDQAGRLQVYRTYFPPWHGRLEREDGGVVPAEEVVLDALICGSINSSTVVVRRSVLDDMPSFDHRYLMGMDTLMWTRIAMVYPCIYSPSLDAIYTYHGKNVSTGEIAARRAGFQVRASRRLIVAEALNKRVISLAKMEDWLNRLPASQVAGILTMLAHPNTDPSLRKIAKDIWQSRREVRYTSGYLRASRILGWPVLEHADRIDILLGLLARVKARFP